MANGDLDFAELRRAVIYGSVMGSFCCEKFGVDRFRTLAREEIEARYREFQDLHRVLNTKREQASLASAGARPGRRSAAPSASSTAAAGCSTTAMPKRTSTSRAASWIRTTPGYDQFGTVVAAAAALADAAAGRCRRAAGAAALRAPFLRRFVSWLAGVFLFAAVRRIFGSQAAAVAATALSR